MLKFVMQFLTVSDKEFDMWEKFLKNFQKFQ